MKLKSSRQFWGFPKISSFIIFILGAVIILLYLTEDNILQEVDIVTSPMQQYGANNGYSSQQWLNLYDNKSAMHLPTPPKYFVNLEELENPFASSRPKCPKEDKKLLLVILVTSAPTNYQRRQAIREAWGSVESVEQIMNQLGALTDNVYKFSSASTKLVRQYDNSVLWKTVFLIGKASTTALDTLVDMEAEKYKDILVGNYVDSYRNLTRKVIHGLKFAAEDCPSLFVLKTDDDCFVNVVILVDFLVRHAGSTSDLYVGRPLSELTVIRNRRSKWFVSEDEYPLSTYPPYASGTGYMLSGSVPLKFIEQCVTIPLFPIEDAFVSVVLRSVGIELTSAARFSPYSNEWQPCNFLYIFTMHHVNVEQHILLLTKALKAKEECPHSAEVNDWN